MRDPGDQVASRVSPASCVSIEDHWGEAEVVPLTSVGSVVERLRLSYSARFWVGDVAGPGFRVAGRRQEVTAKSQASGIMSFPWGIQTSAGRSWPGLELLFPSEDGDMLLGRLRGRHERSHVG